MSPLRVRLGVVIAVVAATGCAGGAAKDKDAASERGTNRLSAYGLSVELPGGWHGRISQGACRLPRAAVLSLATFALPPDDGCAATNAREAMTTKDILLVVSEMLPGTDLPSEEPRIDVDERDASVDRFFRASGRAFMLHATFGSKPEASQIRRANTVLASLSVRPRTDRLEPAPDPVPARALSRARLFPTPLRVFNQCRLAQVRSPFPILCPTRLPRPFLGWRGELPRLSAERLPAATASWRSRADHRYRKRSFGGVSIGYGAPWEPGSGPDWRLHLWRNRPCCFLHFEVFWRQEGRRFVPVGARPATLGGRRGMLKDATSHGVISREGDHLYWPNHTRFLWRENGVPYVASLHGFGAKRETRALLGRLVRGLRPVRRLFVYGDVLAVPPAEAVARPRLHRLPKDAVRVCKRMQAAARFPVLCPARLPRATLGFRLGASPPRLRADLVGKVREPLQGGLPHGLDFSYSAPVEPQSGRGWRKLVWHNRPCCLLHFTIWRRPRGEVRLPARARRIALGGKRGVVVEATGYGLRADGFDWANHTWFYWREQGVPYAASLHHFGRKGTLALLDRLLRELKPASELG